MDLSEVIDAYLVESEELLRDMESILLRTESSLPSDDDLNAIFRAVHTIKGTAGMFGFDATVSFTHVVENLLDELRSHTIPFQTSLTELLLKAKDHLNFLVAEETKGKIPSEKIVLGQTILDAMKPYLHGNESKEDNSSPKLSETENQSLTKEESKRIDPTNIEAHDEKGFPNYLISFRPNLNVFSHGLDPISFIGYLKKIGTIVSLKTIEQFLPDANEFDPENCYLGFEIQFQSEKDLDTVSKVFNFIEQDSFLHIYPPGFQTADLVDLANQLPEEEIYLGNVWKEIQVLDEKGFLVYLEEIKSRKTGFSSQTTGSPASPTPNPSQQENTNKDLHSSDPNKETTKSITIKVDSKRIDNLINRVGELVVSCANMNQLIGDTEDSNLQESSLLVMRLLNEVREISLKLRMVPIGESFQKYSRIVRDLGKDLQKDIRLITEGDETELDRNIVEKLSDPLTHLVRNACDHGLESPEVRIQNGKPKQGTIKLNAYHEAGSVVIEVSDDGNGISKEKVWNKGVERGLVTGPIPESEEEIYKLLFQPGFSTASHVTNVSGRGVGLDVVYKNIEALRGSITVRSTQGKGSRFILRLPLTLAIIEGFLVAVGKSHFIIPMEMVLECLHFSEDHKTDNNQFFALRGNLIPFLRLRDYYPCETSARETRENIVIVRNGDKKAGIVVEKLLGEYQTVIKPMGSVFRHVKGVSGSSILGDGNVALIIDVPSLFERTISIENQKLVSRRG